MTVPLDLIAEIWAAGARVLADEELALTLVALDLAEAARLEGGDG